MPLSNLWVSVGLSSKALTRWVRVVSLAGAVSKLPRCLLSMLGTLLILNVIMGMLVRTVLSKTTGAFLACESTISVLRWCYYKFTLARQLGRATWPRKLVVPTSLSKSLCLGLLLSTMVLSRGRRRYSGTSVLRNRLGFPLSSRCLMQLVT